MTIGGHERSATGSTRETDSATDSLFDIVDRRGFGRFVIGGVTGLLATAGVSGTAGADSKPTSPGRGGDRDEDEREDEDERLDDTAS